MSADGGGNEREVKDQFKTREGLYKEMKLSEYSRPNKIPYNPQGYQNDQPVNISFVSISDTSSNGSSAAPNSTSNSSTDKLCFNVGRELFFYVYKGVKKATDLTKPLDKRIYKGTLPTCHDFHPQCNTDSLRILVGFSAGQVQLIDPLRKDVFKLFNEERLIDKTKVTYVKWVPGCPTMFVVAHASGQMYMYNEEQPCVPAPPIYLPLKQGDGYSIHTCKSKSTRNPIFRWVVGDGSLNQFSFSPDGKHIACVSQDGYLRVFNFNTMDIHGIMKSFFGGLLCASWSPDGKFVAVGGEDDLVTIWSFHECRVLARLQGHQSWVSVVAFDQFTSNYKSSNDNMCSLDNDSTPGSQDDCIHDNANGAECNHDYGLPGNRDISRTSSNSNSLCGSLDNCVASAGRGCHSRADEPRRLLTYRLGSVGQDTYLCLWDLTEDILFPRSPLIRNRAHTNVLPQSNCHQSSLPQRSNSLPTKGGNNSIQTQQQTVENNLTLISDSSITTTTTTNTTVITTTITPVTMTMTPLSHEERRSEKFDKRANSLPGKSDKSSEIRRLRSQIATDCRLYGTHACPTMDDIPILEPLITKKISVERLSALVFREDSIVTGCQMGLIKTWARPGNTKHQVPLQSLHTQTGTIV